MSNELSLEERPARLHLLWFTICTGVVATLFPPAFWLCAVGAALVIGGALAYALRTGEWSTWQMTNTPLNDLECWLGAVGAILAIVPLMVVIARAYLSK
jgi:membrane associated rhomboid family serine protease